jgi:diacylglycerol kinase family enzyme
MTGAPEPQAEVDSTAPSRGVLLVNAGSGTGRDADDLADRFPTLERRVIEGDQLDAELRRAVASGAAVIAVAGGDGTMRSAAEALTGSRSALLAVPTGTFNHFAKALGIETPEAAAEALEGGQVDVIDLGRVNDQLFLNNATVGWYADMLRTRANLERRVPRQLAKVLALARHAFRSPRFTVEPEGRAWLVWVGNGRYELEMGRLGERTSFQTGLLDVRVLLADHTFPRLRALGALLRGTIEESPVLRRRLAPTASFRVERAVAHAGLDGDLVELTPHLDLESVRGALRVVVPAAGRGVDGS